eukprot:CAMPEP_0181212128 /NCGR_PEP_ID=MMETSP1096-20121128/24181_1 /TAXON_ID=156174 ORGANISM="Chrysochromulina ericina, Strain CCMP281" /NCGR_SAMPLE_ID=MMETSP1096 /ASSEMBLY_ACC=CAM_ASM_000453 /LENGTH=139 /DNA_ID=CAMNT_0023303629 /DNA_START=487 /DNA_END=903 /DNA_ORIENTATION=+
MEVSGGEPDNSRKSSFFTTNGTRHSVLQQVAHRKFRRRSLDAPGPDNIARYGFAELFGSHVRSASRSRDLVCKLLCKVPCGRRGEWCPYDRHLPQNSSSILEPADRAVLGASDRRELVRVRPRAQKEDAAGGVERRASA